MNRSRLKNILGSCSNQPKGVEAITLLAPTMLGGGLNCHLANSNPLSLSLVIWTEISGSCLAVAATVSSPQACHASDGRSDYEDIREVNNRLTILRMSHSLGAY